MNKQERVNLENIARDQVERAINCEKWMILAYRVEGDKLYVEETTCEFPHGDFDTSVAMLRTCLDKKLGIAPPEPLPVAPHLMVGDAKLDSGISVENNQVAD